MNSSFYKAEADELLAINNRESAFVKIVLIATLVSLVIAAPSRLITEPIIATALSFLGMLISIIIAPMIEYLLKRTAYKVYCKKDIDVGDLFKDYSKFSDIVLYSFFTNIIILLGILLFIVPGIMLSYSYRLGYFIMIDEPGISFNDAMKKSKEMMKGHRFELFKLNFSFFGWFILSIFTLGILMLWVEPRMYTAEMVFYARLKKELYGEEVNPYPAESTPADNSSIPAGFANNYCDACEPAAEAEPQAIGYEPVSCEAYEVQEEVEAEEAEN